MKRAMTLEKLKTPSYLAPMTAEGKAECTEGPANCDDSMSDCESGLVLIVPVKDNGGHCDVEGNISRYNRDAARDKAECIDGPASCGDEAQDAECKRDAYPVTGIGSYRQSAASLVTEPKSYPMIKPCAAMNRSTVTKKRKN